MSFCVSAEVTFSKELCETVPDKDQAKFNLCAASLMTASPGNHVLCLLHGGEPISSKWVDSALCLQCTFQYWRLSCIFTSRGLCLTWTGGSFSNRFFFQWNCTKFIVLTFSENSHIWPHNFQRQNTFPAFLDRGQRISDIEKIWMKKTPWVLQLVSFPLDCHSAHHSEATKGTLKLFLWHE